MEESVICDCILYHVQGWAKEMGLSCEKVSACLQPATAGHARLVLSKTVPFFCTSLYDASFHTSCWFIAGMMTEPVGSSVGISSYESKRHDPDTSQRVNTRVQMWPSRIKCRSKTCSWKGWEAYALFLVNVFSFLTFCSGEFAKLSSVIC